MLYYLCFMAGGVLGFLTAGLLGALAAESYRHCLRHEILEEALEHDYGTLDSPLTLTENRKPKTANRPL
ncbi:MAG: hypothetical protein WAK96_10515 [Desulfobaccales bacterium]